MSYYDIRRNINRIYNYYRNRYNGISPRYLKNFRLRSKISANKLNKFTNSKYLDFIQSQFNNINKLKYKFRCLNKHSNTLEQILDRYFNIDRKIDNINKVLHMNINKPVIDDIDKYNNGNWLYSFSGTKFDYIMSRYNAVNTGAKGENSVINAIRPEKDLFIQDVNLPDDYGNKANYDSIISNRMNNQMDIVIINKKGIFILEVKNYHTSSFTVDSGGYIVTKGINGKKYKDGNVLEQSENHKVAMKQFLQNNGINNIKIYPLIVCANDNAKFDTHSTNDRSQIVKPHTIYFDFIDNKNNQKSMKNKVNDIYNLLKQNSGPHTEEEFYEPIFTKGYMNAFNTIINYEQEINSLNTLANKVSKNYPYHYRNYQKNTRYRRKNYNKYSYNNYNQKNLYRKQSYNNPYYTTKNYYRNFKWNNKQLNPPYNKYRYNNKYKYHYYRNRHYSNKYKNNNYNHYHKFHYNNNWHKYRK